MKEYLRFNFETIEHVQFGWTLVLIFIFYFYYNRRINNFLLKYIDELIFWIILFLTYLYYFDILNTTYNENFITYILGLSWFLIGFIQFRKNKEHEILSEYLKNKEETKKIENLINNFKILWPIIKYNTNLETLLKQEISTVINAENYENFKNWIKNNILEIQKNIWNLWDVSNLINILDDMIKINNANKSRFIEKQHQNIYETHNKQIRDIKEIFTKSNEKLCHKKTLKNKIIDFIKP